MSNAKPSAACMAGNGTTGDSMMPPLACVSGKALARYGAKRARRALACATSSAVKPTSFRPSAAGAMPGLNQFKGCKAISSVIRGNFSRSATMAEVGSMSTW
ncbi:hypothetical protein D3C81_1975260 [compost metagenome]